MARRKRSNGRRGSEEKFAFTSEYVQGKGNATKDPLMISGEGKVPTAVVAVACNSCSIDRDGEAVENVNYYNLKVFGKDATYLSDYIAKGDRIHFSGKLSPVSYENKSGDMVTSYEVIVSDISVGLATVGKIIDDNDHEESYQPPKSSKRSGGSRTASRRSGSERVVEYDDDDIEDDFSDEDLEPKRRVIRSRPNESEEDSIDIEEAADYIEKI